VSKKSNVPSKGNTQMFPNPLIVHDVIYPLRNFW